MVSEKRNAPAWHRRRQDARAFSESFVCENPRGGCPPEEAAVPVGFLSDAERQRLESFTARIVPADLETYFTLSRADRRQVPRTTSAANCLGFALQLCTLRFLGFCPDDLRTAPSADRPTLFLFGGGKGTHDAASEG
jgi:hypothetical protein